MNRHRPWSALSSGLLLFIASHVLLGGALFYAMLAIADWAALRNPARNPGVAAGMGLVAGVCRRQWRRISDGLTADPPPQTPNGDARDARK